MTTTCPMCKETVVNPKQVDVPEGVELCQDCFEEFVWTCDSCRRQIALPDVNGGESSGFTPREFEMWCQKCCDEKIAICDVCGNEDLVEDMTPSQNGLLCEKCADGNVPTTDVESHVLTKENWRDAALAAISELPDDLQASIGHTFKSEQAVIFTVAGEPLPVDDNDQDESYVSKVEVAYGHSEQNITVEGEADGMRRGMYLGHASVAHLQGMLQLAILEEMCSGGGMSMISKDQKGRFIREDGRKILDWQ